MLLDEKQAATNAYAADSIVYMLALGQTKGRGTKDGGLGERNEWTNIVLSTGEEKITSDISKQGVFTRVIDLECPNDGVGQTKEVKAIYSITEENYGHAGEKFIDKLLDADKGGDAARIQRNCRLHEYRSGGRGGYPYQFYLAPAIRRLPELNVGLWLIKRPVSKKK